MSSYWLEETKNKQKRNEINKDLEADVCIIGAGISGLSTGYYLVKNGLKVIIVDRNNIGEKASGNTTAKITLQHNLLYDYLISSFDEELALKYFESNKEAISNIKKIIDEENIKCDFEYQSNYVYTSNQDEVLKIKKEVKALNTIIQMSNKVHDEDYKNASKENFAEFVNESELPFKIAGGIKLENQAQFHPVKYMYGIANAIEKYGGKIFTNSTVKDVKDEDDNYITFVNEHKIKSKYVVLASHYLFINFPGAYFSKMYQVTSYAMAIEIDGKVPEGMYITAGEPALSFRSANYKDKKILIVAGGNHKTGYSPDSEETYGYKYLENEIKKYYKNYNILYKWDTRDCVTLDKIPYIGEFSNLMSNMYIATGFNKWGMTTSNIAANIITDKILGKENKYEEIYNSTRLQPVKNRSEVKNMVKQTVKSFITNRIKIPKEDLSKIENDNGGIIKIKGISVGIYKDKSGNVFAVAPNCSHLGCLLTWNNLDKTWDCPCHGSRFDYLGRNIYEPAIKNLKKYEID